MNKIINNSYIPVLDSLRAFAAISVCLYHFVFTTTGYITTQWILDIFSVGKYGVQLFFVISGFVIPWAMYNARFKFKNIFTFLLKRLCRLEPPYLFSIILALVILFLRERLLGAENSHIEVSTKQVLLHLGYLIPFFKNYHWLNQVYWTLAIEFQYYFFIALLFIPLLKAKILIRICIYSSIVALSFIGTSSFLFYGLPVFLLGILVFLFLSGLIHKIEFSITLFLVFSFCLYKYDAWSVIYMSILVASLLFFRNAKILGLHFLGKFSYSIYLIHPIIGASIINILSHHVNTTPIQKIGVILLGILVTIFGAWITYIFIESPSKKCSAKIIYS